MTFRLKHTIILLLLMFCYGSAAAQFYPTQYRPDVNWQQLSTDHFKIVFPHGEDSVAYQTARILENQYPHVQQITGGGLTNFPVILTNYNDRSNGLVTPLHFRSEIDIAPILGKTLNPETGGWLQNVVPHELVHALQFSNAGGFGLGQLIKPFSPDLSRALHGASPAGIQEGLATYYESEFVTPGGGRGNYPFFTRQFDAILNSPGRWSMGQMVHFPSNTRPFSRHYIGGYMFTKWLQETYGKQTSRDAIDFHIRWPFLGYGVALKHATGQWPGRLYARFKNDMLQERVIDKSRTGPIQPLQIPYEGPEIRRPMWLSDSSLVFHGSFYNANPGFYRYHLPSQKIERVTETTITSDYNYTLSSDYRTLLYSIYKPDPLHPNVYKATLQTINMATGNIEAVNTHNSRLFNPTFAADSSIYALQTHHTHSQLVELAPGAEKSIPLFTSTENQLVDVTAHPTNADSIALIINRNGTQGLWLVSRDHLEKDISTAPDVSFTEGSVFDPVWHPNGNQLLFSADFSGTLQIYEYDLTSGSITQWTNTPYNAFEASYSPDGSRIAFVIQQQNTRVPAVLSRDETEGNKVTLNASVAVANPESTIKKNSWISAPYSPGWVWLKPRTILPVLTEIAGSNEYQWGVGFHSSDLLQQQAYSFELSTVNTRLWYDLIYQNKQFFPGFRVRVFSEPAYRTFRFEPDNESAFTQRFLRQERGLALSIPMNVTFEQNVNFSGLYIEPEMRWAQFRYFYENANNQSDFTRATVGNLYTQLNYKLEQNIRDVQPKSGFTFYGELEHYFRSASVTLTTQNGPQTVDFARPTALKGGLFTYIAPMARWNQSLRLGIEALTQTHPVWDLPSVFTETFSDPTFPSANNLLHLSARYTVPLWFPDDGGLLLPLYLNNIYLVGFSDTATDPTQGNLLRTSRTMLGAGLRVQFRISNLAFDIGVGLGVEPSRNKIHYVIGDF